MRIALNIAVGVLSLSLLGHMMALEWLCARLGPAEGSNGEH